MISQLNKVRRFIVAGVLFLSGERHQFSDQNSTKVREILDSNAIQYFSYFCRWNNEIGLWFMLENVKRARSNCLFYG